MPGLPRNAYLRTALIGAAASVCLNGLGIAADWYAVSPHGTDRALWTLTFLALPWLLALLVIPVSLIVAVFRRPRRVALSVCLGCFVYFVIAIGSLHIGQAVRMHAFGKLAERSKPLVAAINQFTVQRGYPPETLEDLVPEFLPEVPTTGMDAYPDYQYYVSKRAKRYGDNPWVLMIATPSGFVSADRFLYFPNQDYSKQVYPYPLKRISDWAYSAD